MGLLLISGAIFQDTEAMLVYYKKDLCAMYPGVEFLGGLRMRKPVYIAPGCRIGYGCDFDKGVEIFAGCKIGSGVSIGENVTIGNNVCLGAGCRVGCESRIVCGFHVGSGCQIGQRVLIGSSGVMGGSMGPSVIVGDDACIGGGGYIRSGMQISYGAILAPMTHLYEFFDEIESTSVVLAKDSLPVTIVKSSGCFFIHKIGHPVVPV